MKIGIAAPFFYKEATEEMYAQGFERLGHEVIRNPTAKGADIAPSILIKSETIKDWDILVVVGAGQEEGMKVRINAGLASDIPIVKLCFDNITRKPHTIADAEQYDRVFLSHNEDFCKEHPDKFHWLPFAYDQKRHYWDGRSKEGATKAAFIGTGHPDRQWLRDIPGIEIYGNSWGNLRYPIFDEDKRVQVWNTRCNINFHSNGDTSNMRQFEIPAMHGFMLTDRAWPFVPEKEVIVYSSPADLERQMAYFLESPDEREKIASAAYKAIQPHTYEARAKEMLKVMGL